MHMASGLLSEIVGANAPKTSTKTAIIRSKGSLGPTITSVDGADSSK